MLQCFSTGLYRLCFFPPLKNLKISTVRKYTTLVNIYTRRTNVIVRNKYRVTNFARGFLRFFWGRERMLQPNEKRYTNRIHSVRSHSFKMVWFESLL